MSDRGDHSADNVDNSVVAQQICLQESRPVDREKLKEQTALVNIWDLRWARALGVVELIMGRFCQGQFH